MTKKRSGVSFMFANPRYTRKTAPVFIDSARFELDTLYYEALRPCIVNDEDKPPKTLIAFDTFSIPASDYDSGNWDEEWYDLTSSVCLTPEDVIRLIRHLNHILTVIFNDHNYVEEVAEYRAGINFPKPEEEDETGTGEEEQEQEEEEKETKE